MPKIKRGSIYYANLSPAIGSEEHGIRPVLIVQNNVGNYFSSTVIILPITTKKGKLPTHIKIPKDKYIKKNSTALCEQIRVIDKRRLKQFICKLSYQKMKEIDLAISLALNLKLNSKSGMRNVVTQKGE